MLYVISWVLIPPQGPATLLLKHALHSLRRLTIDWVLSLDSSFNTETQPPAAQVSGKLQVLVSQPVNGFLHSLILNQSHVFWPALHLAHCGCPCVLTTHPAGQASFSA